MTRRLMIVSVCLALGPSVAYSNPPGPTEEAAFPNAYSKAGARTREEAVSIFQEAARSGDLKLLPGWDPAPTDLSDLDPDDLRLVRKKKGTRVPAMLYRMGGAGGAEADLDVVLPEDTDFWSMTVGDRELLLKVACGNPGIGTDVEIEGRLCAECEPCARVSDAPTTINIYDIDVIVADVVRKSAERDRRTTTGSYWSRPHWWYVPVVVAIGLLVWQPWGDDDNPPIVITPIKTPDDQGPGGSK